MYLLFLLQAQTMSLFHNLPKYVDTVEEQIRQLTGSNFISQVQKTMNFNVSELVSKASSQATKILKALLPESALS